MLFPIDVVVAVMFYSMTAEGSGADGSPLLALFGMFFVCGFSFLFSAAISFLVSGRGPVGNDSSGASKLAVDHAATFVRVMLVVAYIFLIDVFGWRGEIFPYIQYSATLSAIVGVLPHILMLVFFWAVFRKVENRTQGSAWKLVEYLSFKSRFTYFIIAPWLVLSLVGDLWMLLPKSFKESVSWIWEFSSGQDVYFQEYVIGILILIPLVWIFPAILVRIWKCKPLPEGELKIKLNELERKAGIKFSKIYVWNLGGRRFLNAAAVGFLRPCRYLLISRGLLDSLSTDELCGVVGHELGHVKHRHLLWYMFFTVSFLSAGGALLDGSFYGSELSALVLGCLVAVYLRFVFGYVSRRFERQADLFSLKVMEDAEPLCRSLENIGIMSGNIRNASSWHHGSIAERVAFLRHAQNNQDVARLHNMQVIRIKLLGFGLSMFCLAFSIAPFMQADDSMMRMHNSQLLLEEYYPVVHWLKAEYYLEDDFECALNLAILADSGKLASSDKAEWLRKARLRAKTKSEKKLLKQVEEKLESNEKTDQLDASSPDCSLTIRA